MLIPPPPPKLENLKAGTKLIAGHGVATILPDIDFETYSEAGFVWNSQTNKFQELPNATKKGLPVTGTAVYSEHPSTEVLSLAYDLKNGNGKRLWKPGDPNPIDLFFYVSLGGVLEAWNCSFERWIWNNVCVSKYGFPPLALEQLRDAMAKSRAFGLPGSLDAAGSILDIKNKKNKDGKRLINKFSIPRNPTKHDTRKRITPESDSIDAKNLYEYNIQDIAAEAEISSMIPDLTESELKFWLCDQAINVRGVRLDRQSIMKCLDIIGQAFRKYNPKLIEITNGAVSSASQVQKLKEWIISRGIKVESLDSDSIEQLMGNSLPEEVRAALEIRALISSAAVKKLYAMNNQITSKDRIHDLFMYHAARTGRAAGAAAQPQNLPNGGAQVCKCPCGRYYGMKHDFCPWCGIKNSLDSFYKWNMHAVTDALETISAGSLECVEYFWDNAFEIVSGCLRSLFIASPGHDLICSDYSAIEAVVLAFLAQEQWRMDVFNTHGMIYEMSASKITGVPFEEFIRHKKETDDHHPLRKTIGKVAELASGYQGWIGAWKAFGAEKFFNEQDMKKAILTWRRESPKIVEFWGGQMRDWFPCYYGLEGAAVQAVLKKGEKFSYNGISYFVKNEVLYCELLSGRCLVYHKPQLARSIRKEDTLTLSYETWNTNPKYGAQGWVRLETYGGKLCENVVQATARDILAHAIINLEDAGYPVVLHVHDEIVCEIPEGFGSVEEFEKIMSTLPSWAFTWPVKAKGGWRGKRYGK